MRSLQEAGRILAGRGAVFCVLAGLSALPAHAQTPPDRLAGNAVMLRDKALAGSGAYEVLESLTTETGPRPAGSPAFARAKDWGVAKLKALGFQNVHAEPFTIWAWFKGAEIAEVTAPFPQPMIITALGGSVATPPQGLEAEIVLFRTWDDLAKAPAGSLTGKIAVLTERMGGVDQPNGYGVANRWRRKGASETAKRGGVGFMLRSLATNDVRDPHSGALNYDPGAPQIPAAALSGPDADQLERMAARGKPIRVKFTLRPTYLPQATSWNVVGDIPGSAKPDEVVLVSGHLDSWGLGTGAVDDGAGVAITTAAARLAGGLKPRRTIRVVMWGAEETDQAGGAYRTAHESELGKIVVAGESDFGAERVLSFQVPAGAADTAEAKAMISALAPIGTAFNVEGARNGGDDVGHIYAAGVPVVSLRQDGTHYFDLHHSMNDTLDKIDAKALDSAVAAWAPVIYAIADSDIDFRKLAPPSAPKR